MSNPDYNSSDSQKSPGFFDFGFTRFITNTWISFIWMVCVGVILLGYVIALIAGLSAMFVHGSFTGVVIIILAATVAAALCLLFTRISLELTIVVFRIETHLRALRNK